METTVNIRSRAGNPTPWLEVDYPGLRPPLALFADLEMIGWKPPAIQPPPATAIDWSTPNTETGERFTIRDYPVGGAVVAAPAGSGRDGAWTDAERHALLTVLARVLERHGVAPEGVVGSPAPVEPGPAPAVAPPPPTTGGRRFGRLRDRSAATPETRPSRVSTRKVGPVLPLARRVDGSVVLEATCELRHKEQLVATTTALGLPTTIRPVEARLTESYRGTSYETVESAVQAVVLVPLEDEAQVTAALADVGLIDPEQVLAPAADVPAVEVSAVDALPVGAPGAPAELAPVTPIGSPSSAAMATIEAVFDPNRRSAVLDELTRRGLDVVAVERSTRTVVSSYRGSSFETEAPGVRIVLSIEAEEASRVAALVASLAHLDPSDPSQLAVVLPPSEAVGAGGHEERRPFRVISAS